MSVIGVEANHSSTEKSVASGPHPQSNDAVQDIALPKDPNISGKAEMIDCHPYQAGPLSGWQENDDYRAGFGTL